MNWVQINIQVNEDFRYMKIHIFALRWRDVIKRSSQLRTLLKRVVFLFTTIRFSSVLSCEDLLIASYGFFLISINHANKFIDFQGEAIKHCPE